MYDLDMSNDEARKLYAFFKQMIIDEIKSSKIDKTFKKQSEIIGATVISVATTGGEGDDITINFVGDTTNIVVKNFNHNTLIAGDIVEVVVKNGNYGNAYIGWKRT